MRICSPQLGLAPNATLGGEVYDREILAGLADLGVEIDVILPAGLACIEHPNLTVTRIPLSRGYRWYVSNLVFPFYVRQVYRLRPFDLLRVHSLRFTGIAALASRRLFRLPVPVVAHHHHLDLDRLTGSVDSRVVRSCDLVITGSEFSKSQLCDQVKVPREQVQVIRYGVNRSHVSLPRDEALAAHWDLQGKRILLHVGSLKERKNLPILIQAFSTLMSERDDVCLVLVGQGPCEEALRAQVRELGLEQAVCFVGPVSEEEKIAWYNLCDVFVFPSRLEGFGLVVAEAMACGKPVVASRAASLPEVVAEGETGLLCNPDDPADFARAIQRLLQDQALSAAMGQAGADCAHKLFQWSESARQTLALYEEMVHGWQT